MSDSLRSIAIFATVVDQGTIRAAALYLGLAPSRISQAVSNLEKNLGVTLLYRSTRQLSLTHEGQVLYEKATVMLNAAESGLDAINPVSKEPNGAIRITAPAFVTQTALMDTFAAFAVAYPKILLKFDFSDRQIVLIKDGFDVAIRAGWLEDSEFLTSSIGHVERLLVASPTYVGVHPAPVHPRDLEIWNWVRFSMRPDPTEFISPAGDIVSITGKSNVSVNSADALFEMAVRHLGLTVVPEHLACRGIDAGNLVQVLPHWSLRPLGLHAVWPDQSRRENLTMLFVRFLAENSQKAQSRV